MSQLQKEIYNKQWLQVTVDTGVVVVYTQHGVLRGNDSFEIKENGEFIQHSLGPADEPVDTKGRWRLENGNVIKVDFQKQLDPRTLQILYVDEGALILKKQ